MKGISVSDFLELQTKSIVVDVRTPSEYAKGHVVGSVNMPLFSDEERAVVGTVYKKQGRNLAVERGLEFVGGKLARFVREARKLTEGGEKKILLYCWRGGMRSNSLAWLLHTAGINVNVLIGGYKSYRRYFLSKLHLGYWRMLILGGPTGCGKSDILNELHRQGEQVLDLEALARHRGSAFGVYGYEEPQPTSEQFGNEVFDVLSRFDNSRIVWCEGESASIGKVFMSQELYNCIQASQFIYFTLPVEERLNHIMRDYGNCPKEILIKSFNNISKRLGYDRAKEAIELIEHGTTDDIRAAANIALQYYDKGYGHSIEGRKGEIVARIEAKGDNAIENANILIKIKEDICKK